MRFGLKPAAHMRGGGGEEMEGEENAFQIKKYAKMKPSPYNTKTTGNTTRRFLTVQDSTKHGLERDGKCYKYCTQTFKPLGITEAGAKICMTVLGLIGTLIAFI